MDEKPVTVSTTWPARHGKCCSAAIPKKYARTFSEKQIGGSLLRGGSRVSPGADSGKRDNPTAHHPDLCFPALKGIFQVAASSGKNQSSSKFTQRSAKRSTTHRCIGGLHIFRTERHDAPPCENQRAAPRGTPGGIPASLAIFSSLFEDEFDAHFRRRSERVKALSFAWA